MDITMVCAKLLKEYRDEVVVPALLISCGGLKKNTETYLSELDDDIIKIMYTEDYKEDAVTVAEKYLNANLPELREACYE